MGEAPAITDVSARSMHEDILYARFLDVTTRGPATLEITWADGDHQLAHRTETAATTHEVPLFALRPDGTYEVEVTAVGPEGLRSEPARLTIVSDPLIDPFPVIDVLAHDPAKREPGYLFLPIDKANYSQHFTIALDMELEIAWATTHSWGDVRMIPSTGTLMGERHNGAMEKDFFGSMLRRFNKQVNGYASTILIDHRPLHHEVYPLDDGGFVSLTNASRWMIYPLVYADPDGPTQYGKVKSPVIVHIDAAGQTVAEIDLGEVLDMRRIGYDSLSIEGGSLDWAHGNAVVPHHEDGYIISLRHQDAVVRVDRQGNLKWILGNHDGYNEALQPFLLQPVGDVSWAYHQHAPEWFSDGRVLLFDNGNHGTTPYSPDNPDPVFSRVAEYRVDEENMTVEMLGAWSGFTTDAMYAQAYGDANELPITKNILATFGFIGREGAVQNNDNGWGTRSVRIVEFSRDDPANPAVDLRIRSDVGNHPGGWTCYRGVHVRSLGGYLAP